jgi:hypothetical protein
MDDYRKVMLKVYTIMESAKSKREEIVKSGLSSQKMTELLQELKADTAVKVKDLNDELNDLAGFYVIDAAEAVDKARRTGRDAQLMVYHQNRARSSFDGYTGDELLQKYPEVAGMLLDDEKAYLYTYEDELRARARDSADLDGIMFKHKTPDEKLAIVNKDKADKFINTNKTITGLIEMEVESVLKGEAPAGHDFGSILDEMK